MEAIKELITGFLKTVGMQIGEKMDTLE